MNDLFVNVKVDREERPDVDALTMDACVTMTGQGGWPTTVFLTPDGRPFYAGTYFPPEPRHGIPSFRQLLQAIAEAWRERRDELETQAEKLVDALGGAARLTAGDAELSPALLDAAERHLARDYEPAFGGFGTAPKFPPSSALELLLRRGGPEALGMVRRTLDGMSAGGLYDVVGGGFHRYSVDARWLVPHFEKMLYDNALLVSTYLHGWVVTGEERYRIVVEETIAYLLREMRLASGGFASAQDADTDGVEGLTYTWTPAEWEELGLDPALLEPFEHGRSIVRGELDAETKERLLAIRERRPAALPRRQGDRRVERPRARRAGRGGAPARARGLARGSGGARRVPPRPAPRRRRPCPAKHPRGPGERPRLPRRPRERRPRPARAPRRHRRPALAARGAPDRGPRGRAVRGSRSTAASSSRPTTGSGSRRGRRTSTTTRRRRGTRCSRRCSSGSGRIWGDEALVDRGADVLRLLAPAMERVPRAFSWGLCTLHLHLSPPREVAIVGDVRSEVARAALGRFQPETVVAVGPSDEVPLLEGKGLVDGLPAVYVCERFACRAPVTRPSDLNAVDDVGKSQ